MSEAAASSGNGVACGAGAQARRVLFICYDFPPCTAPGALSCAEITGCLPLYGWDPIVLTVHERYYVAVDRRRIPPVPVIRTRVFPHPLEISARLKASLAGRDGTQSVKVMAGLRADGKLAGPISRRIRDVVLSSLGTPDMRTGWIPPAVVAGLRACRQRGISRLVSSGPCWTNHLVGLLMARLTRLPWVAHFRDPWTHSPASEGDSDLTRRFQAALERMVVARADRVVCVTDRHTHLLRQLYPGLRAEKFVTIPNGYDGSLWQDVGPETPAPETSGKEFVITYAGSIDDERTPEPVFRAARRLIDAGEVDIERLRFDFIGWCDMVRGRPLDEIVAEHGLTGHVHVEGPLMKTDTFRRLAQSDLLLLLAEGLTLQVPSKAYEYLRAGQPVLALAPRDGAVADLFARTGGGWVIEPTDYAAIEAILRDAYCGWRGGRKVVRPDPQVVSRFDRAQLTGQLAEVLDGAPAEPGRPCRTPQSA